MLRRAIRLESVSKNGGDERERGNERGGQLGKENKKNSYSLQLG